MIKMPQNLKWIVVYLAAVAAAAVVLTVYDKAAAKKGAWRIPEATLMGVGLFGGALPMLITMKLIRHKTKHMKFMIGLPAEIALHAALVFAAIYYLNR